MGSKAFAGCFMTPTMTGHEAGGNTIEQRRDLISGFPQDSESADRGCRSRQNIGSGGLDIKIGGMCMIYIGHMGGQYN